MSSDINFDLICGHLTPVIVPIQIVLGIVTNIFNVFVLSRQTLLQRSPWTHYFLAIAVTFILVLLIEPELQFMDKYHLFSPYSTLADCKLLPYLLTLVAFYISMLLMFATCDRYCNSSVLIGFRRCSSVIIARRAILILTILLPIIVSSTLYINDDCGGV
ncbi:unnamed protein product [Rotaria magnacalcarata]|uniref:G-protein coupled receptors family 1 profile domain-containing protein n=1 Tax=Rotaria magnacalcarata TaxID=392030 RepID=A0A816ZMB7_9BILA|nr:unnamed protein product [Rotaria magnacalcarata]